MKYLLTTLIFLVFVGTAMAAEKVDCRGYNESFDVRVLDAKIRPIEGALIQATFDRGTSFGPQYFTTEPRPTNKEGVLHLTILNQGTVTREIDCTIWLNATVGGAYAKKTIEVDVHGPIVDLLIDAYPLEMEVNDQNRDPIENATVTIGGLSKTTDSKGKVLFYAAPGSVNYLVSYYKGKESGVIVVTDDTDYEVILSRYSISIDAVDDSGTPLEATLTILEETLTMEDGHYETDDVYGSRVDATVSYGGIDKEITIFPATESEAVVAFDIHPPVIEGMTTSTVGDRPRLTIDVTDPGEYASDVNPSSVSVTYRILPATGAQWSNAATFVSGENRYVSDFPPIESGKIIEFRVEVEDYQGNKVIRSGSFVTAEKEPENGEVPTEPEENGQEIPLFYIAIGVILIIVAFYIVKHFTGSKGNEV